MSMTYNDWLTAATTILQITDSYGVTAFTALYPRFIEYAELRIYRDPELDFLATRTSDVTQVTNTGVRSVPIPSKFIVIESVSLITPLNTQPALGQRLPLLRTTRSFCDMTWPTESQTKTPAPFETYWALYSMFEAVGSGAESDEPEALPSSIIIAPTPDNQYIVEYSGVFRPAPLSVANPTTYLTTYLPDLFLAATMIIGAGYQRDYGAAGTEDPALAVHWEQEYQKLKQGAAVEEQRKKSASEGWSPYIPEPLAGVPRGQQQQPMLRSG